MRYPASRPSRWSSSPTWPGRKEGAQSAVDTIARAASTSPTTPTNRCCACWPRTSWRSSGSDEALAEVDAALKRNPEAADLHVIRGNVSMHLRRSDEAAKAFETARSLDSENATALAGLAILAGNAKDFARAVELFDLAAKYDKEGTPAYAYSAAQLTLQLGDESGAMERLRAIVRKHPGHAGSRNDLAWLLAESGGNLDTALSLAEDARRLDPSPTFSTRSAGCSSSGAKARRPSRCSRRPTRSSPILRPFATAWAPRSRWPATPIGLARC